MGTPRERRTSRLLATTWAVAVGAVIGICVVAATDGAWPFWGYYDEQVTVPSDATGSNPYVVEFHGATFSISLPYVPPGTASTGVTGPAFNITEPSGALVKTGIGCAECDASLHTWYSSDGSVGIAWFDGHLENPTLLVRR